MLVFRQIDVAVCLYVLKKGINPVADETDRLMDDLVDIFDGKTANLKKKIGSFSISSFTLHILAMLLMLSDHAWSTLFPTQRWMTAIGRIAFPIFAFMLAEGFYRTSNFKKYLMRMIILALISEIPFNLMMGGSILGPYHQSVMVIFIIGLLGMKGIDHLKKKDDLLLTIFGSAMIMLLCFAAGFATFGDYFGTGVLMIFVFYFFHERKVWCFLGQFIFMYWLNVELLGGLCYKVTVFGHTFELVEQGFALIALIPIWLYKGRQGHHSKAFRYFCYAFYPVHMLVLFLIGWLMTI